MLRPGVGKPLRLAWWWVNHPPAVSQELEAPEWGDPPLPLLPQCSVSAWKVLPGWACALTSFRAHPAHLSPPEVLPTCSEMAPRKLPLWLCGNEPDGVPEDAGLIPASLSVLRAWRCCGLWCRSQMQLRCSIAVAVAVAVV